MIINWEIDDIAKLPKSYHRWIKYFRDIDPNKLDDEVEKLKNKYSESTYNLICVVLKKVFNKTYKCIAIESETRIKDVFSLTEILILETLVKPKYLPLFQLIRTTGLRLSEAINLEIDPTKVKDNVYIITQKKTKRPRKVYFIGDFDWKSWTKPNYSDSAFQKEMSRIQKTLQNKKFSTHTLRHCFAMMFYVQSNHNLLATSEALGHSSPQSTYNYLKENSFAVRNTMDKIDLIFQGKIDEQIVQSEKEMYQKAISQLKVQQYQYQKINKDELNIGKELNSKNQYVQYLQKKLNLNSVSYNTYEEWYKINNKIYGK